ncbi:MAG: hypothetical protein Q9182_000877 [Xanthomendoza sp. 2 TL-2023]
MPRGVASTGGAVVDAFPLPETESSGPSRSATADIRSAWDDGDFISEFGLPYRSGEMAPLSANMLTSTTAPVFESGAEAAAAPQDLVLPSKTPKWNSPYLTSSLQNDSMSKAGASRENDPRNNCVWRHPAHTATLLRLQVAEAKNELLESQIEVERERVARFQEQARHAQQMQQVEKRAGRRRELSNDHYVNASRKRSIRPRTPKEQPVTNRESLLSWIRDCEEYIGAADYGFATDIDMVTWSASLLVQKRKDQWRTYADALQSQGIEITWKTYCEYLTTLLSGPETRLQDTGYKAVKHSSHDHREGQRINPWSHGSPRSREGRGSLRGTVRDPEGDTSDCISNGSISSVSDSQTGDIGLISSPRPSYGRRKHAPAESDSISNVSRSSVSDSQKGDFRPISSPHPSYSRRKQARAEVKHSYRSHGHS